MKLRHWHLHFHRFHPTLVFTVRDKELQMSTPAVRIKATTEGNNKAGEKIRAVRWRWKSYLERWPRVCERGHSYYRRGWWESGAGSPSGGAGVEQCGGNYACRWLKTPGHTPHTAELTGPEGQTEADGMSHVMLLLSFRYAVRRNAKAEHKCCCMHLILKCCLQEQTIVSSI